MPASFPRTTLPERRAQRSIEVYDFSRPTTLAREHSRQLDLAFETFARQWGTQLTTRIGVSSTAAARPVAMKTYDEYAASLPVTTAMVLCALGKDSARAIVQFPVESALQWVRRMLGGSGAPVPARKFTDIEQALVRVLMDEALNDMRYSFGPLLPERLGIDSIVFNSQFAQAASPDALMIVAAFDLEVGEEACRATVALPAKDLLARMGSNNPMSRSADAPAQLRAQVGQTPVEVSLTVPPIDITPAAVLELAVGDVLPLAHPTQQPFDLQLGGKTIARAAAVTHGSRRAGHIVSIEENAP